MRWGEPGSGARLREPGAIPPGVQEGVIRSAGHPNSPQETTPSVPRRLPALAGEAFGTFVLTLSGTATLLATARQPCSRTRPRMGQGGGPRPGRDPDHAVPSSYTQIRRDASMKRVVALVMGLMILLGGATACGSSSSSTPAAAPTAQSASASPQTGSPSAASCASVGTRKIPKTRLLADLALAYGAFHRYLYRPYQAGTFRKGADGRVKAIIKAGLATAAIIKLLSNAEKNAAADPTLCKFVPSMGTIKASLGSLAAKIRGGTATSSDANSTNSLFEQLKSGTGFTTAGNASLPGLG